MKGRKMDQAGRIMIPKKIYKELKLEPYQKLEILIEYGELCLRKYDSNINLKNQPFLGIVREMDRYNRISIPEEYREKLDIHQGSILTLKLEEKTIKVLKNDVNGGKDIMREMKKIDHMGRFTIPKEAFDELEFEKFQEVEITIEYGKICLRKFDPTIELDEKPYLGIVRRLDERNHISIPTEYRSVLGINESSRVRWDYNEEMIRVWYNPEG